MSTQANATAIQSTAMTSVTLTPAGAVPPVRRGPRRAHVVRLADGSPRCVAAVRRSTRTRRL